MSSVGRRHRSSTAASFPNTNTAVLTELEPLIKGLDDDIPQEADLASIEILLQERAYNLHQIRQYFIEGSDSSHARDAFRHLRGFQVVISSIRCFVVRYDTLQSESVPRTIFFDFLAAGLGVLAEALKSHPGNKRYFIRRVNDGGWQSLENALSTLDNGRTIVERLEHMQDRDAQERFYGCLFALATGDESMKSMFGSVRRFLEGKTNAVQKDENNTTVPPSSDFQSLVCEKLLSFIGRETLENPEVLPVIFTFWCSFLKADQEAASWIEDLALTILFAFQELAKVSLHNLVASHASGLLSRSLPVLFDNSKPAVYREHLNKLCLVLIPLGASTLSDAELIFKRAQASSEAADFLLESLKLSSSPAVIQFDLFRHGYSSVELPSLGRAFPPSSPSNGYSVMFWMRVDEFDTNSHTTIFGTFDPSQTCFVLAYLERDTRNFILQTSVTSSRPSVRFKSTTFQEKKWYHIALVHRRPRATFSSKALLYVDGEFVEQAKCTYPANPPMAKLSADSFPPLTSSQSKPNPVQAFLGTPQDLSSRLGHGLISSRWSLTSFHLFEEALSDDLVAVYYHLGPRYWGNFQDCLGSFQTYENSAALMMRNELMHPGKDEKSEIVSAIRYKAGSIVPEGKILLSILPTSVIGDKFSDNFMETQLVRSLSKSSAQNLKRLSRSGANAIAVNGSVASINDALSQLHGVAVLTGDPVVAISKALDDASWRLNGCTSLGLDLVTHASTKEETLRGVEIMFQLVKENWRNSEAVERESAFNILGCILRDKLGQGDGTFSDPILGTPDDRDSLTSQLLDQVLGFVGYRHGSPQDSAIVNPLAYRILLVDLDIWRKAAVVTQGHYYHQFVVFSSQSKHHHFNNKRLMRMRILKKMLDSLKKDYFSDDTHRMFLDAFKALSFHNISADFLRAMALYITYSLQKREGTPMKSLKSVKSFSKLRRRATSSPMGSGHSTPIYKKAIDLPFVGTRLTSSQLGTKMLEFYSEILCKESDLITIKKFAKTVTNKWLLYLLAEDNATVVSLGTRILARLLVTHGPSYVSKFASKTGGFVIMKQQLKRWWNVQSIWPSLFCILFGRDATEISFHKSFDLFSLIETFYHPKDMKVMYQEALPLITTMLGQGLRAIIKDQDRSRFQANDTNSNFRVIQVVTQFLADIHSKSVAFRDFAASSAFVQELLWILLPIIASSDPVSAETELHSRDSALTFEGEDVMIKAITRTSTDPSSIVRTSTPEDQPSSHGHRVMPLRRGSSFVLVTPDFKKADGPTATLKSPLASPIPERTVPDTTNAAVQQVLELIMAVSADQIFERKDFPGLGLFLKVPPGFREHQAYFETYVLRNTLLYLSNAAQFNREILQEPRVLINLARFISHVAEAVLEGWFIGGADPLLDFAAEILEYLQKPDVAGVKSVRLCSQAISSVRETFHRVIYLRLSELRDREEDTDLTSAFLKKMMFWQTILLSTEQTELSFLRILCYLLYLKLISSNARIQNVALDFWRIILMQKPAEMSSVLLEMNIKEGSELFKSFKQMTNMNNSSFLDWVSSSRSELDVFFLKNLATSWEEHVESENKRTAEMAEKRVQKRKERLQLWASEESANDLICNRNETSARHWTVNIYSSEHVKFQRSLQDAQDDARFVTVNLAKLQRNLTATPFANRTSQGEKWRLDETEGRDRMRLRILPHTDCNETSYQPKEGQSTKLDASLIPSTPAREASTLSSPASDTNLLGLQSIDDKTTSGTEDNVEKTPDKEDDEEYELVDNPNEQDGGYEDKNRKVMRSLQRGDQVHNVFNASRIVGLEACEGLLILGKDNMYLLDNFFQRLDGEIVNVWQASSEERDPYLQMIAGRDHGSRQLPPSGDEHESRHWRWDDLISISKRHFLFRDVAIEVFFTDGRSYLLTAKHTRLRDEIHSKIIAKATHAYGTSTHNPEDSWRIEQLRSSEDMPQTFGYKISNVFNTGIANPATRKWARGEISNFHYLMLINTMAGRTFNDLTQYPVFPWVLADYTSEHLDLSDPRSFRDLTKPMGAQTLEREADFRERYKQFAEMGDENAPAFHYGTHYSSAMIVTSYLIRMQPFVKSYLLLQGGNFDHADRLFFSVARAWKSASRDNMTDVRELIPEFFYLPEFLENTNGYNFGIRQATKQPIDKVELPPWAKGDPKIFVKKHREALESPHVSKNLHAWIDLVFGYKQRGEAAIEATNVFHYLSYHGAKDLDKIEDPVERLATIGIIHNFGQTPYQIFQRAHPEREEIGHKYKRLDIAAESLTKLPFPLLENGEKISTLVYSTKQNRLLCSGAFRLNLGPNHDRYLEWGFVDNGVRFYMAESGKIIGLFEHVHQSQISCAAVADSRTLITAGYDCVVSAWSIVSSSKSIDLHPKSSLFGHKAPVTCLAVSRSFSCILTASTDGEVVLWDLNRLEFVRKLSSGPPVECACINDAKGTIMVCRDQNVTLYTLNGEKLAEQNVCQNANGAGKGSPDDYITSCAFYEGTGREWLERELVFTGHRYGVVNVWSLSVSRHGHFGLALVHRLNHFDHARRAKPGQSNVYTYDSPQSFNQNLVPSITAILPMPQAVYTGDEDGRVFEWDCVQRHE